MPRNPIEKILLILLALTSCQNLTSAFNSQSTYNELKINEHGNGKFFQSTIESDSQPQLARAYEQGILPKQPLLGPSHANWARTLEVALQENGEYLLKAKALAPYPIEMFLIKIEQEHEAVLAQVSSKIWARGVYFAQTSLTLQLLPDQLLALRTKSNKKTTSSIVKLVFIPQ